MMGESVTKALDNAGASSAMEGLWLNQEHRRIVEAVLKGEQTLDDVLNMLRGQEA